ncbi:thioredoxin family protein [Nocardiopsis sp. NPDC050513]|uniref:thioredoxin family protein n=1 Tax=Nocardiopsis sp. NPDC050513 TaxID=3364338 RepID=UPI0037A853D8
MTTTASVAETTDDTFTRDVLEADLPVLVEFTADWCPPCRQLAPVLESVARELRDRMRVVRIDVDRNPRTTASYGVLSMPTMLVFQGGEPVRSMVGARSGRRLLQDLDGTYEPLSPTR